MKDERELRERTYYIDGISCAACELIIEKKLIELDNVRSVDASLMRGEVLVEYEGEPPGAALLDGLFEHGEYRFSLDRPKALPGAPPRAAGFSKVVIAGLVAVVLVFLLERAGLSELVKVDSKSTLPAFLLLGLVAGFSSCAALVGGMVLSMSKQWGELYSPDEPMRKKLEPHLLFNSGRLISYTALGAALALIGSALRLTSSLSAILVIAISIIMALLGLQMLGVSFLQRFRFAPPKSVTRFIADESHFKRRYMPFALGTLTFFLPCGFTITAQGFALISGDPLQGALIMLAFSLGTLPMLLLIAFSSVKFLEKPRTAELFLKAAGVIVVFFAIFNINNQLVVLNAPSLGDLFSPSKQSTSIAKSGRQLPPIVDGNQVLEMKASASSYTPGELTVRAGVPVRWEIEDVGTSGCTNAIISRDLFEGQIELTPGKTSVKEFTPEEPGRYRFSCWMGMVSGVITVVDEDDPGKVEVPGEERTTPSPGGC